ncbi:glycosyltransferase family 2 protein [Rhodococcus fascians]|nr:glycosyltransferase family 2 protein [Rhodococcus fascians]
MPASNTLTVVIPCRNEEQTIGLCLESLRAQASVIHEVVVVDNNSTDRTADRVREFMGADLNIVLVHEEKPGVAFARNTGFSVATGEILGRIDADTRVQPGWAAAILTAFSTDEPRLAGVTGLNLPYDSPLHGLKKWWFGIHLRKNLVGGGRRLKNLHGANMAIRRDAWVSVREMVSTDSNIHEDLDLALCLNRCDFEIAQLSDMNVECSPRRALTPPREFTEYIRCGINTFELHNEMTPEKRKALRLHWWWHILVFAIYRPYDPIKRRFSLRYLLSPSQKRSLPVSAEPPTGK